MAKTRCEICNRTFKNEEALRLHNLSKHQKNANENSKNNKSESKLNPKPKKKIILIVLGIIVILIAIYFISSYLFSPGEYDPFAKCISESGAKFYGAYWCPHCNEQKELFGKSKKYLPYVECSLANRGGQNLICSSAFIESYPTWVFPDGSRQEGLMSFEQLSEKTNCSIN